MLRASLDATPLLIARWRSRNGSERARQLLAIQPRQPMFCEEEFEPMQPALAILSGMSPGALLPATCQSFSLRQFHNHGASENFFWPPSQVKTDSFQPNINAEHNRAAIEVVLQPFVGLKLQVGVSENFFFHGVDAAAVMGYKGADQNQSSGHDRLGRAEPLPSQGGTMISKRGFRSPTFHRSATRPGWLLNRDSCIGVGANLSPFLISGRCTRGGQPFLPFGVSTVLTLPW